MTLLYSYYTSQAVVFAADSQITSTESGRRARRPGQKKIIRFPRVGVHPGGAVLGFCGNAYLGDSRMTMSGFLRSVAQRAQSRNWPQTDEFVEYLIQQLDEWRTPADRRRLSGFHVGAFEQRSGVRVPVFWFIVNAYAYNPNTGIYGDIRSAYRSMEQLLGRDLKGVPPTEVRQRLSGAFRVYRNGTLALATAINDGVVDGLRRVLTQPASGYAMPRTAKAMEDFARATIDVPRMFTRMLYRRGDPPIGGRIVVEALDWNAR